MKNTVVLEMLNNGEIEQLKALLTEEIYTDSLKGNNAKQRYSAMKRFFKFVERQPNKALQMPCENVSVHNETYNSFIDGHCFVLTKESIGEIETYKRESNGKYFDIEKLVNLETADSIEVIDLNSILADAKTKGYKYKKSEFGIDSKYRLKYKDAYINFALFDKAYNIINDGEKAEVYYTNRKSILYIKTSIGLAGVLPLNVQVQGRNWIVIDAEN